jgi:hypothetical protein
VFVDYLKELQSIFESAMNKINKRPRQWKKWFVYIMLDLLLWWHISIKYLFLFLIIVWLINWC